ncbi:MAG: NADH-quinone oxidoreductase subunit I [Myxococcales bacterium]|nr:NADH-quinone oxidoreductase subunit I [Myxococcales bacterium]
MAAQTVTLERQKRGFWVQTYLPEIFKGMGVTLKHFFGAIAKPSENIVTVSYPEEQRPYPARYRGRHRLMVREDGQVRCVACMCCSTICPANCIHIEAAEHDDPSVEKYPETFVIDQLRCIVCGLCVEACPCDAIRMDTGVHCSPFIAEDTDDFNALEGELRARERAFYARDLLMEAGDHSRAVQGGRRSF